MFQLNKKILKYLFQIFIYITIIINVSAKTVEKAVASKTIFQDSFEGKNLKSAWRQANRYPGPNTLVEISNKAAFNGKQAVLLYDNNPKQALILDYIGKLPQSGAISGYLMFPKNSKGVVNSKLAYSAIRFYGTERGSNPITIAIRVLQQNAIVCTRKDGKSKSVKLTVLPSIVSLNVWVPWRIAWQWDGKSQDGKFRVTIGDKETDIFTYPASKFRSIRFISGWGSATSNSVYYDSISIESGEKLSTSPLKKKRHLR